MLKVRKINKINLFIKYTFYSLRLPMKELLIFVSFIYTKRGAKSDTVKINQYSSPYMYIYLTTVICCFVKIYLFILVSSYTCPVPLQTLHLLVPWHIGHSI